MENTFEFKNNSEVIDFYFKKLVGKLLTVIEASTSDKTQRDSLKKLIETELYANRDIILNNLMESK